MTVQDVMINDELFEGFSYTAYSGMSNIQEMEKLNASNQSCDEDDEKPFKRIINFLYNLINQFIQKVAQVYYDFKEALPKLFDNFIETYLKFIKSDRVSPVLSFEQIYEIFELFGIEQIYPETINKISACFQWKIIPSNWIEFSFLNRYQDNLLSEIDDELYFAIDNLKSLISMIKIEEDDQLSFEKELNEIIQS